jgi:hypothetical protein
MPTQIYYHSPCIGIAYIDRMSTSSLDLVRRAKLHLHVPEAQKKSAAYKLPRQAGGWNYTHLVITAPLHPLPPAPRSSASLVGIFFDRSARCSSVIR